MIENFSNFASTIVELLSGGLTAFIEAVAGLFV